MNKPEGRGTNVTVTQQLYRNNNAGSVCEIILNTMDDLLALFDENPPEESEVSPTSPSPEANAGETRLANDTKTQVRLNKEKKKGLSANERRVESVSSNVDERIGFRITKRLVSSMDLLDLLTSHPYQSPASLSAMNLKQLNAFLVDPARVIDRATVAGKTNLMTIGIVFNNTGTRMASSGNAFTIVTIGTLRSGPAVSLMLFGSAYGKFCRSLKPGAAIAVMNPRLVSPKGDYSGETNITFSLNEERQITILGTATDFGICKAKVRGKNERGVWVTDARRCKNFVDLRVCEYCQQHRSQMNKGTTAKVAPAQSRMQAIRQQEYTRSAHTLENQRNGRIMTMPSQHYQPTSRFSHSSAATAPFATLQAKPLHPQSRVPNNKNTSLQRIHPGSNPLHKNMQSNSILNPRSASASTIHNKTPQPLLQPAKPSLTKTSNNPYAQKVNQSKTTSQTVPVVSPAISRKEMNVTTKKPVQIASLIASGKRSSQGSQVSASKKPRLLNTEGVSGFDGSVVVPKPKGRMAVSSLSNASGHRPVPVQHEKDESCIREKQRELAQKIHSQKVDKKDALVKATRKSQSSDRKAEQQPTLGNDQGWCAPLDDAERERLRNVKSAFSSEADAELFVASRRAITELEKEEERKMKKGDKGKEKNNSKHIHKMWRCLHCQQLFQHYPKRCYNERHDVAVVRELRETASQEQKRTALSNKKTEEGGLKLGSGIAWTWNRFS